MCVYLAFKYTYTAPQVSLAEVSVVHYYSVQQTQRMIVLTATALPVLAAGPASAAVAGSPLRPGPRLLGRRTGAPDATLLATKTCETTHRRATTVRSSYQTIPGATWPA